jgi:hypothetical protein
MRLQLTRSLRPRGPRGPRAHARRDARVRAWASSIAIAIAGLVSSSAARAQVVEVATTHTLYTEAPTRTKMTVYTPGADLNVNPFEWLALRGGYEADVVSGASVAVKAGPAYQSVNPGVDVVTTASVHDVRHSPHGGLSLKKGDVTYGADYTYSIENDYSSHSLFVSASTEAYEHNTQFELSYARNWDSVCDRVQAVNDRPARYRALEDSSGCFGSAQNRTTRSLDLDGLQASWSQSWTPVFATQLVYTAQILDGFQSNPYRSIILGQGIKAQEHHPGNRARQAVALRGNFYVRPLKLAVHVMLRAYHDTWDISSGTGELEVEKYIFEGFRFAVRGRYYKQTGALFWSDDYTGGDPPLGPKGQYWTGDRELSPFSSIALGLRFSYGLTPTTKPGATRPGRYLGFISGAKIGASADVMQFSYDEYTLGGTPIDNARAGILGLNASAAF